MTKRNNTAILPFLLTTLLLMLCVTAPPALAVETSEPHDSVWGILAIYRPDLFDDPDYDPEADGWKVAAAEYTPDPNILILDPDDEEVISPGWTFHPPENLEIPYGVHTVTLPWPEITDIRNIGTRTIMLTIESTCIFSDGNDEDTIPVTLYIDGNPVVPGEKAVFGRITAAGIYCDPITLQFQDGAWEALSSGRYTMTINYSSYLEPEETAESTTEISGPTITM